MVDRSSLRSYPHRAGSAHQEPTSDASASGPSSNPGKRSRESSPLSTRSRTPSLPPDSSLLTSKRPRLAKPPKGFNDLPNELHAEIAERLTRGELAAFVSGMTNKASALAVYREESDLRTRVVARRQDPDLTAFAASVMAASTAGGALGWSGLPSVREAAEVLAEMAPYIDDPEGSTGNWDAALKILDILPRGTGRGAVHALLADARIEDFVLWDRARLAASRHAPPEGDAEAAALLASALEHVGLNPAPGITAAHRTLRAEAWRFLPDAPGGIYALPPPELNQRLRHGLTRFLQEAAAPRTGEQAAAEGQRMVQHAPDFSHPRWQDGITAAVNRVSRLIGEDLRLIGAQAEVGYDVVVDALRHEVEHLWRLTNVHDRARSLLDEAEAAPPDQLKHRLPHLLSGLVSPATQALVTLTGDIIRAGRSLPVPDQVALCEALCLRVCSLASADFVAAAGDELRSAISAAAQGETPPALRRAVDLALLMARVPGETINGVVTSVLRDEVADEGLTGLSDLLEVVARHGTYQDFQQAVDVVTHWLMTATSASQVDSAMGLLVERAHASYSGRTREGKAIVKHLAKLLQTDPPAPNRPLLASALAQATSALPYAPRLLSLIGLAKLAFAPNPLGDEQVRTALLCAVAAQRHTLPSHREALTESLLEDENTVHATSSMLANLMQALDSTPAVERRVALHEPAAEREAKRREWLAEARASGPAGP